MFFELDFTVVKETLFFSILLLERRDGFIVLFNKLFRLLQFLMFLFTFKLVLDHNCNIILNLTCHFLLHFSKLLTLFIKHLSLGNNFLFLSVESLINTTLFSFLLQQPNCLHRPLTLDYMGSNLIHITILEVALSILLDSFIYPFK